jgi:hypothetical protein
MLPCAYPVEFRALCLQRAKRGIDLIQKEILPGSLERLPQTEDTYEDYFKSDDIQIKSDRLAPFISS